MVQRPRILAFVLAGGEGSRLHPLTAHQPKPALPFADGYRIIDFVLSNLLNSRVTDVYVLVQYKPQSLVAHIDATWHGRFTAAGGLVRTVWPPSGGIGGFRGTADAVRCGLALAKEARPDLVAVFAADHVYRMDVRQMRDFHVECDAEVSISAMRVPVAAASSFGVIVTDRQQRIVAFDEKPEHPTPIPGDPTHAKASMGIYLFAPRALASLLDRCLLDGGTDFGHHLMPALPGIAQAYAYDFSRNRVPGLLPCEDPAYWRDVGTPEELLAARHDTVGPAPRIDLSNRAWPMHKERRGNARTKLDMTAELHLAALERGVSESPATNQSLDRDVPRH